MTEISIRNVIIK